MAKVTRLMQLQSAQVKKKIRVAAYCRVSTSSDEQMESLETQRTYFESYIKSRSDWTLAGIYFDEGITGTKKDKRTGLLQLVSDCETHQVDLIVTKSLSRFSRNTTDCLELVRRLLAVKVPIYFEKENLNTGSMESELLLSIMSSLSEEESVSISENTKWSIQKRFESGTYKIGYAPYGFISKDGQLIVNPVQANIIKRIFKDYLSGLGVETIAQKLNDCNVPTRRSGKWHDSTILGILANEKYLGDTLFQKTYTDSSFNRHPNCGDKNQFYCKDHHEAIISREDFAKAKELIKQHCKEKGINKGSHEYQKRYAFSKKIICGNCGAYFRRRIHSNKDCKYIAWTCKTHIKNSKVCSMLYIRNDTLELAFLTMMNKLIYARKPMLIPLFARLKNTCSDDGIIRIRELETKLLEITEQRQTLQSLMAQGYLDQLIFIAQKNALMQQTKAYHEEIEMIQNTGGESTSRLEEVQKLLRFTEHADMLQTFQDDVFSSFVESITVYSRNELSFKLKCGLNLKERI